MKFQNIRSKIVVTIKEIIDFFENHAVKNEYKEGFSFEYVTLKNSKHVV